MSAFSGRSLEQDQNLGVLTAIQGIEVGHISLDRCTQSETVGVKARYLGSVKSVQLTGRPAMLGRLISQGFS